MTPSRAVLYAVDDSPSYLAAADRSIESLRRHNAHVPVLVAFFGDAGRVAALWRRKDVQRVPYATVARGEKLFMKWRALTSPEASRYTDLIFLDADTLVFQDLSALWAQNARHDFYAREEIGTSPLVDHYQIGTYDIRLQVDHSALDRIRKRTGSRPTPIFNTGVMMFNRAFHTRIAAYRDQLLSFGDQFRTGATPLPSRNFQLFEEVSASLCLGLVPGWSYGFLPAVAAPWFIELEQGVAHTPGVVLHTWACYYRRSLQFLRRQVHREDEVTGRVPTSTRRA